MKGVKVKLDVDERIRYTWKGMDIIEDVGNEPTE